MTSFYRGHMKTSADVGTIVGPNSYGEFLVAKPCEHGEEGKMDFWTAGAEDIRAVKVAEHSPCSLTEVAIRGGR